MVIVIGEGGGLVLSVGVEGIVVRVLLFGGEIDDVVGLRAALCCSSVCIEVIDVLMVGDVVECLGLVLFVDFVVLALPCLLVVVDVFVVALRVWLLFCLFVVVVFDVDDFVARDWVYELGAAVVIVVGLMVGDMVWVLDSVLLELVLFGGWLMFI